MPCHTLQLPPRNLRDQTFKSTTGTASISIQVKPKRELQLQAHFSYSILRTGSLRPDSSISLFLSCNLLSATSTLLAWAICILRLFSYGSFLVSLARLDLEKPPNMYRCAAGKLPMKVARSARCLTTSSHLHHIRGIRQNALVTGRKPLAVMTTSSVPHRNYAIAAEESNKGVVSPVNYSKNKLH